MFRLDESKFEEIDFIRGYLRHPSSIHSHPNTISEFFQVKKKLYAQMHQEYFEQWPVVTNLGLAKIKIGDKSVTTFYTRQGSQFIGDRQSKVFYPFSTLLNHHPDGVGFFVTSGQMANFSAAYFLKLTHPGVKFKLAAQVSYFETNEVFEFLKDTSPETHSCLVIDSGSSTAEQIRLLDDQSDFYIFDTTCSYYDEDFDTTLRYLISKAKPILLTRSHIKLDTLGVEYGSLGSVYILNPEKLQTVRYSEILAIESMQGRDVNTTSVLNKVISITGGHSPLSSIPPFFWDKRLYELNQKRLQRMKHNYTTLLACTVKTLGVLNHLDRIDGYPHQLYVKTYLDGSLEPDFLKSLFRLNTIYSDSFEYYESFGLDKWGISRYRDPSGKKVIRLVSGDATPDPAKLTDYLHQLASIISRHLIPNS